MCHIIIIFNYTLKIPRIEEADFTRLESFPLLSRWNDARWNELPSEALNDIQPLKKEKARELCQYSLTLSNQNGLIPEFFVKIEETDAAVENEDAQSWLLSKISQKNSKVVVSWTNDLAVLVSWEIFCSYWDDFCYPASDDVAIFPLSEDWMLLYDHAEVFTFGERYL